MSRPWVRALVDLSLLVHWLPRAVLLALVLVQACYQRGIYSVAELVEALR